MLRRDGGERIAAKGSFQTGLESPHHSKMQRHYRCFAVIRIQILEYVG
jgi:hypothetical protein